jgi:hypothetical protein
MPPADEPVILLEPAALCEIRHGGVKSMCELLLLCGLGLDISKGTDGLSEEVEGEGKEEGGDVDYESAF